MNLFKKYENVSKTIGLGIFWCLIKSVLDFESNFDSIYAYI